MEIRNFKVIAQTEKRIDFTCEGKGRLVDWNWIEGFSFGPLENDVWPAEWVVVIQRGGKEIKRRMKLSERSKAITRAIKEQVALYVARNGTKDRGPLESKKDWPSKAKDWPAKGNSKVARSGSKSTGPQGQNKTWPAKDKKEVARSEVDPEVTLHNIQGGPKKDPLEMPEFLRR